MAFDFIPHTEFLSQLFSFLEQASDSDISRLTQDPDWTNALIKIVSLNLDQTVELMHTLYVPNARRSYFQLETFRSLVLMSHFRSTSYEKWAVKVRSDLLLAALSEVVTATKSAFDYSVLSLITLFCQIYEN